MEDTYRCKGGMWSLASKSLSRPRSSPAVGYILHELEKELRILAGDGKALPSAGGMLERWLHSANFPQALLPIIYGLVFSDTLHECAIAAYNTHGALPADYLTPSAAKLNGIWLKEPYRTLLQAQNMQRAQGIGAERQLFLAQGQKLAAVDSTPNALPFTAPHKAVTYAELDAAQLGGYVDWRANVRQGKLQHMDTEHGFALLYCAELFCGIGTEDPFASACELLRLLGAADRKLARELPRWILDCYVVNAPQEEPFWQKIEAAGLQSYYPAIALHMNSGTDLFNICSRVSNYKPAKGSFYRPEAHDVFENCLRMAYAAFETELQADGINLTELLVFYDGSTVFWHPYFGLPAVFDDPDARANMAVEPIPGQTYQRRGGTWRQEGQYVVTLGASVILGALLKRMEARMREKCGSSYRMNPNVFLLLESAKIDKATKSSLIESGCWLAIDRAVDVFFANSDSVRVLYTPRTSDSTKRKENATDESAGVFLERQEPKPVSIDPERLAVIREQTEITGEMLHIAEEEPIPIPQPVVPIPKQILKPAEEGIGAFWNACSPEQKLAIRGIINHMPDHHNELFFEELNELALETIGDTLIDTNTGEPVLYEEYLQDFETIKGE
jgi:hypothetical protein